MKLVPILTVVLASWASAAAVARIDVNPAHSTYRPSLASRQPLNTVQLTYLKRQYLLPVDIGPDTVHLVVDTGSPFTSVLKNKVSARTTPFDPEGNWGVKQPGEEWRLQYMDDKAMVGKYAAGSVSVGTANARHVFLEGTWKQPYTGVAGFAFPFRGYQPLWWQMGRQIKTFAVLLGDKSENSQITFGGPNPRCMTKAATPWVPIDMTAHNLGAATSSPNQQNVDNKPTPKNWIGRISSISLGMGKPVWKTSGAGNAGLHDVSRVLFDTGASTIHGPADEVAQFYATVFSDETVNLVQNGGKAVYQLRSTLSKAETKRLWKSKSLTFTFGNGVVVKWAPPEFWIPAGEENGVFLYRGLIEPNTKKTWWTFGQPFLKSFYSIFEADVHKGVYRVGLAEISDSRCQ